MRTVRRQLFVIFALLLFLEAPDTALAHREDYIDETLVFETVEQGAIEPEYWFDYGHRSDTGTDFTRHNIALEYGITRYWMLDGRATIERVSGSNAVFDSGRLETRYRFFEEGTLPIDIALSGELNLRRRENGSYQYGVEPRLILSKDFGKLNLTVNLAEELPLNRGDAAFEIAATTDHDAWINHKVCSTVLCGWF